MLNDNSARYDTVYQVKKRNYAHAHWFTYADCRRISRFWKTGVVSSFWRSLTAIAPWQKWLPFPFFPIFPMLLCQQVTKWKENTANYILQVIRIQLLYLQRQKWQIFEKEPLFAVNGVKFLKVKKDEKSFLNNMHEPFSYYWPRYFSCCLPLTWKLLEFRRSSFKFIKMQK